MSTLVLDRAAFARPVAGVRSRILLIDAIRALAATAIAWHHFAQYWPLSDAAQPALGDVLTWLHDYTRAAQVFFVIGGFVMAQSMSSRRWTGANVRRFLARRYLRLGIPYLAVMVLAIGACAIGRGWLSDDVVGAAPTFPQVLAHTFFLQDILGYPSLSAGFWFVCINFQLGLVYVCLLWMRDWRSPSDDARQRTFWRDVPLAVGFVISVPSLFFFSLDERWAMWCIYFFSQFYLGILAQRAVQNRAAQKWFAAYVLLFCIALAFQWRWKLAISLGVGVLLYLNGLRGVSQRWSAGGVISYLGRSSYSFFLIHFSVMVVVASLWLRLEWNSPELTLCGLALTFAISLLAAAIFYRIVEESAARWSKAFA